MSAQYGVPADEREQNPKKRRKGRGTSQPFAKEKLVGYRRDEKARRDVATTRCRGTEGEGRANPSNPTHAPPTRTGWQHGPRRGTGPPTP